MDLTMMELGALIDDDELLMFAMQDGENAHPKTFDEPYERFNIANFTDDQCKAIFRFTKDHIYHLKNALEISPVYKLKHRHIADGFDVFCLLLRRLAYPNRLLELEKEFGRPKGILSAIIGTVNDDIYERFHTKFSHLQQPWCKILQMQCMRRVHP